MSMLIIKSLGASLLGAYVETKYGPDLGSGPLGLPTLFGVTPLSLTAISFWSLLHGFLVVGRARSKYIKLAKEAGEKEVDERYALPNLYAQGTSQYAMAFNCIQRSHQHIFETFTTICVTSVIGAVHYPICTAITTLSYGAGRIALSNGYASGEGDAGNRYSSPLARFMWYGVLCNIILATVSSVSFMTGKPVL